jgi:ubiquinone/menaquinone biosynthesis C-methylase UbiE
MPCRFASDYSTVTELPGGRASSRQAARLRHRYHLAALHAAGRDVLEVGCGAGLGLGWLSSRARRLVGGDYCSSNLRTAQRHYNGRVPLLRFDAAALPFRAASFDVVVMFEALYYLPRPGAFIAECRRVLCPGGLVVIGAVNPAWSGFHPSPYAERYFSAAELRDLLTAGGLSAELAGGFREAAGSWRGRLAAWLKRGASKAGLIPKTMRGREPLKRIFFGPLETLPAEIHPNGFAFVPPVSIDPAQPNADFTVLYALGRNDGYQP